MADPIETPNPAAVAAAPAVNSVDPNVAAPAVASTPGPNAAPAAPAVAAAPVAQPAATVNDNGTISYEPTGDVALDLSLEFFGGLGLALDSPEMIEAGKGNFQYLEAKLAALGEKAKGYERYLGLAKEAHGRLDAANKADVEKRRSEVHEAVGGEENWKSIVKFVDANATPEERAELKGALAQGGIVAKAVATMLHGMYAKAPGTTLEPASAVRNQPSAPANGAPLTLAGYRQELDALVSSVGSHRVDGSPEYAALRRKYAGVSK